MERRQVLFEIKKVLKNWEDSKLDISCADEILTRLEELGYHNSPMWPIDEEDVPGFVELTVDIIPDSPSPSSD